MNETNASFVTSDGTELHTKTVEPDASRYDVLIVHGLGEHSGRWLDPARQFAESAATVHILDLRGHGQSEGDKMHVTSFSDFHDDIAQFAATSAAASGRPWVMYGHSMGGLICAGYLVDDRSPAPNAAVISAPALDDTAPRALKAIATQVGRILPNMKFPTKIEGEHLASDPSVGEHYFADPFVQTEITAGLGREFAKEQSRLADRVGEIVTPTYVIHGAEDPLVPPSASAGFTRSPSVTRRLHPNLRHELHNEAEGAQVIGDVIDWIEATIL